MSLPNINAKESKPIVSAMEEVNLVRSSTAGPIICASVSCDVNILCPFKHLGAKPTVLIV
jgi:hypothetical protein